MPSDAQRVQNGDLYLFCRVWLSVGTSKGGVRAGLLPHDFLAEMNVSIYTVFATLKSQQEATHLQLITVLNNANFYEY